MSSDGHPPELPTGSVTFLFTDIEASAARWDADAEQMDRLLKMHNLILEAAIADHGGHVVKTMGDGHMVVFSNTEVAIRAAVAAQTALADADWGEARPLASRMGIHRGHADLADGDYVGPEVTRAARIGSAGHGGQIHLSELFHRHA